MDFVCSRLGYCIDPASGEPTKGDVVGRKYNLKLVNDVDRERGNTSLPTVRTLACESEYVVVDRTIDVDGIVAVVRTGYRDTATSVEVNLRRQAHIIVDVPVEGWHHIDVFGCDLGARPGILARSPLHSRDHDGLELGGCFFQLEVKSLGFSKSEIHIFQLLGTETGVRHLDVVGADPHIGDSVVAAQVSCGPIGGASRSVHSNDCRAHKAFACDVRHLATDRGGGYPLTQSHCHKEG